MDTCENVRQNERSRSWRLLKLIWEWKRARDKKRFIWGPAFDLRHRADWSRSSRFRSVGLTTTWRRNRQSGEGRQKNCGSSAGGWGVAEFCRRPLSGPSGMKSPGDRKRRPSRGDRRFVKVLLPKWRYTVFVSKDPQTRQKPTRPPPRVINTSGNVLTNYLTCRFLPDSTVN